MAIVIGRHVNGNISSIRVLVDDFGVGVYTSDLTALAAVGKFSRNVALHYVCLYSIIFNSKFYLNET